MYILANILRMTRKSFRIYVDLYNIIRLKFTLTLNNVNHGSIICHGFPYIAVAAGGKCIIGDNFTMSNGVRFNPIGYAQPCYIVVIKGATLKIGNNVGMSQASIICHKSIIIEDNVKIGGGVKIYDTNFHSLNPSVRRNHHMDMLEKKCKPVIIQHDVFIGAGTIVLAGVTIGANSVVGAGSVVTKSIPANEIWGGNPAHFIKKLCL